MRRLLYVTALAAVGAVSGTSAAPVPAGADARALVARLADPDPGVRDRAAADLRGRVDARPWLRRADRDAVRHARPLVAAADADRRAAARAALAACTRDGRADLFGEWYHFWQPKAKEELWAVGWPMGKAALDRCSGELADGRMSELERGIGDSLAEYNVPLHFSDGPIAIKGDDPAWCVRTDRYLFERSQKVVFAAVHGPIDNDGLHHGYFHALGPTSVGYLGGSCLLCDGPVSGLPFRNRRWLEPSATDYPGVMISDSFVAARGDVRVGTQIVGSIVLVDGTIDLRRTDVLMNSRIRATGDILLPPRPGRLVNCKIEPHAKNATAPYTFFELAEVGLSVADDEEGLVVRGVKPNTPFGDCGLAKGDLIRAIDDAPAGHAEPFRKAVRRALVRQGDCLLTIARGDKTHDLPVFFPLPK